MRCASSLLLLLLSLIHSTAAVRLVTTTTLPNVTPERALSYLATPTNWPDIVLSSWSVRGDSVDKPLPVGSSVDEIFGLPPILPLEVSWTCTADGNPLIFNAPEGLAGIAENCCMEFTATPDGSSTNIELVMSYDPVSPLADIASPILAIDNAIALKLTLPSKLSPLGSSDPIAGPLVAFARSTGLLPKEEEDGWTGEPSSWAESDSIPQRLSEFTTQNLAGFKQFVAESVAGEYDKQAVDATLDASIREGGVVVFAFSNCPFCKSAKELLDAKGADYKWVLIEEREDGAAMRARLGARTGRTSVPSVWIGGDFVGGLNDGPGLATLDKQGVLDERLRAVGALA